MVETQTASVPLVVSVEEAEDIITFLRQRDVSMSQDEEAVGLFLLLLQTMAYCNHFEREYYLFAAHRLLMPFTSAFQEATDGVTQSALDGLRGVKRVEVTLRPDTKRKRGRG